MAVLEPLANRRVAVIIELLRDVLYAFNWQRPDDLPAAVTAVLKDQRLI